MSRQPRARPHDRTHSTHTPRAHARDVCRRTYITQGQWDRTLAMVKAGDVVTTQFGHNDSSPGNDTRLAGAQLGACVVASALKALPENPVARFRVDCAR